MRACGKLRASQKDQGLERGHDAERDGRDDALELAELAEEAEEAEGPQHPELLDPAVGPAPDGVILPGYAEITEMASGRQYNRTHTAAKRLALA